MAAKVWSVVRFVAGVASAGVFVHASGLVLDALRQQGQAARSGWLYSANGTPWSSTDADADMKLADYPQAAPFIETWLTNRARRAVEVLSPLRSISADQLLAAKFDVTYSRQSHMASAVTRILAADSSHDAELAQIQTVLRAWDFRSTAENRGAAIANLMFELPAVELSTTERSSPALWLSEVVATVGLLLVIQGCVRTGRANVVAFAVAAWIAGAYWFTSSTSFANPAVTVARTLSDTFAGIAPSSAPMFIVMQLIGMVIAFGLVRLFYPHPLQVDA